MTINTHAWLGRPGLDATHLHAVHNGEQLHD